MVVVVVVVVVTGAAVVVDGAAVVVVVVAEATPADVSAEPVRQSSPETQRRDTGWVAPRVRPRAPR